MRGRFADPDVQVDKGRLAARGLGAFALGFINPLLALIPLIDPAPGKDADCAQLVRDARALPRSDNEKKPPVMRMIRGPLPANYLRRTGG